MLGSLTLLLVFQLIGEVLVQVLALPVPGPVVGLLLLFLGLLVRGAPSPELEQTAGSVLQHFSLLFVPAGAGVLLHVNRIGAEWLPIVAALILSTLLSIAVTALVLRAVLGRRGRDSG